MTTILLIDDEKPTLDMLGLFLGAYGYETIAAENGEEGVALFKENLPAIVMTDIKMPGMDGIEVLKEIKSFSPDTEVIVVTGHGDMDLAIQALNLNATDFINKPIQKEALEAALRRAEERIAASSKSENVISMTEENGVAIMTIQGNITSRSEPYLQEACNKLILEDKAKVVMHFEEQATINGAGIALLTQLLLEVTKKGHKVAIAGLSDNFQRVFDVVGITRFATLQDSREEAVKALS